MGNAPSGARKRPRSSARGKTSQTQASKRPRKQAAHDSPDTSPIGSLVPGISGLGIKWKPATGSAKLTQDTTPAAKEQATPSASSRRKREKDPPLVVATSGPRSRKGDSRDMYAVEAIVKKWIGPSDRYEQDVFYLIHFVGQKRPPTRGADESLWQHPTQMRDCKHLIKQLESQPEEPKRSSRQPTFYYASESEEEEGKDKRLEIESTEVNGRCLRKRQDPKADKKAGKGSKERWQKKVAAAAIGFDRGLKAEEIIGSTHHKQQLLYAVKWKDSNTVDYVVSTLCHEKAPDLVVDYLVSKLQNVPSISSADLAL